MKSRWNAKTNRNNCIALKKIVNKQKQELEYLKEHQETLPRLAISSGDFWEQIYRENGTSGYGSYNRLARFKADIINGFVKDYEIKTVVELGCGDGNQLSYMKFPLYTGIDVSSTIIEKNKQVFLNDRSKCFYNRQERSLYMNSRFELSLSLDVIFHLLEDEIYEQYMDDLFELSSKYVIIYSSNHEAFTPWPEFRHRNFMYYFQQNKAATWRLKEYIPNEYPYLIGKEEDTSCSDFYIFEKK